MSYYKFFRFLSWTERQGKCTAHLILSISTDVEGLPIVGEQVMMFSHPSFLSAMVLEKEHHSGTIHHDS